MIHTLRFRNSSRSPLRRSATLALAPILLFSASLAAQQTPKSEIIKKETLPDGVEHWYIPPPADGKSFFLQKLEELYSVVIPPKDVQPFGRSFALLVGVSRYKFLSPQLPSVQNDVDAMRKFLLEKAGFDEVYVAANDIVNRDLVEQYIKATLPSRMAKNDRLLFYYSGHGGDNQGNTGYLLFSNAQPGQFYGNSVLEITSIANWGSELKTPHLLIILDSCASGLGIASKSGNSDSTGMLLQTLSGNGSRTILTAGTAAEKTYAEEGRQKTGNSFFTKALLDAFDSRAQNDHGTGFITITDLFADTEKEMAAFRAAYGKSTTPRMWPLQEFAYRGTFVFLNPRASAARLSSEQAQALGVKIASKGAGDDASAPPPGMGAIEVRSKNGGHIFVDDSDLGPILSGNTVQFFQQAVGQHKVRLDNGAPVEVRVSNGNVTHLNLGYPNPVDTAQQALTGTVVIHCQRNEPGEVFVDGYSVGHTEKIGDFFFPNILEGSHEIRVTFALAVTTETKYVTRGQTTDVNVPAPPTGLTATVH